MTSRERVWRAIRFAQPDRLPMAKGAHADMRYITYCGPHGQRFPHPGVDEWGCGWTSLAADEGDQGQVTYHPLNDWDAFPRYCFPDPDAPGRLDHAPAEIARYRAERLFICGTLGKGPMHLLADLRGFENYLTDMLDAPARIELLLDGIFTFLTGMLRHFARLGVDAIYLIDDQATQNGPLFSMDLWRRHLAPRYQQLFSIAHAHDLLVYMHTCGNLRQHLEALVDVGVDLIDNKQPACWMTHPAVQRVKGRVAFSSCIDIQQRIAHLPPDAIAAEVEQLVRTLSTPAGGFIGTFYHQADLRIPPDTTHRMLEAFTAFSWERKDGGYGAHSA